MLEQLILNDEDVQVVIERSRYFCTLDGVATGAWRADFSADLDRLLASHRALVRALRVGPLAAARIAEDERNIEASDAALADRRAWLERVASTGVAAPGDEVELVPEAFLLGASRRVRRK
jgi:hypothetical protein